MTPAATVRRVQRPLPPCAECGAPVAGAFCAACGQKAEALRQPVHHVLRDAFVEFFGLDGRVWRTFASLAFRPGALTASYFRGQRQRYLRPLRVYLTSTLLFFVLLSTIDPVGRLSLTGDDAVRDSTEFVSVAAQLTETDSVVAAGVAGQLLEDLSGVPDSLTASFTDAVDSAAAAADGGTMLHAPLDRDRLAAVLADADSTDIAAAQIQIRRARAEAALLRVMPPDSIVYPADLHDATAVLYPDSTSRINFDGPSWLLRSEAVRQMNSGPTTAARQAAFAAFLRASVGHIPTVMFFLLPLFAALLKLLYIRRRWFFAEHIVFGLHTHAFAFVVFAVVALLMWGSAAVHWKGSDGIGWVVVALLATIPFYFLAAMKRVYGQGWGKTLVKAGALAVAYNTALAFGLVAASLLAAVLG